MHPKGYIYRIISVLVADFNRNIIKLMSMSVKYQKNDISDRECLSVEREAFFWYY